MTTKYTSREASSPTKASLKYLREYLQPARGLGFHWNLSKYGIQKKLSFCKGLTDSNTIQLLADLKNSWNWLPPIVWLKRRRFFWFGEFYVKAKRWQTEHRFAMELRHRKQLCCFEHWKAMYQCEIQWKSVKHPFRVDVDSVIESLFNNCLYYGTCVK